MNNCFATEAWHVSDQYNLTGPSTDAQDRVGAASGERRDVQLDFHNCA
jgi:hypothetical protein